VSTGGKTAARAQNAHPGARVAIVRARWNDEITRALARGAAAAALAAGAKVEEFEVAGSFELPPAVAMLGLHAMVANHYTRYNLILIGPFSAAAAWFISERARRRTALIPAPPRRP